MNMNISMNEVEKLANVLRLIGQPARIQILLILAQDSACVCHIEAITGIRQAAISQQLTVLRKADLVRTVREGRHIFYSLTYPEIIADIYGVAEGLKISRESLAAFNAKPVPNCPCPRCNPDMDPALICKKPDQ
jgi:DNA-binding transcriptional ArsR family regulator